LPVLSVVFPEVEIWVFIEQVGTDGWQPVQEDPANTPPPACSVHFHRRRTCCFTRRRHGICRYLGEGAARSVEQTAGSVI